MKNSGTLKLHNKPAFRKQSMPELLAHHRDLNDKLMYLVRIAGLLTDKELAKFCGIQQSSIYQRHNRGEMLCRLERINVKKMCRLE